ncbi:glycosyltransferase family 1 protein [Thermodesulfobacterium sp. TA1]|uniref:alpha-glucan family phosphorylase n=1 Tax=Thermodesulfobacterium sp. TA1 TaxID=2234087 RepID=UPI001232D672|nr:alpha-glucan family phosphorylase [Thermodesulfobacterium sp. TA1]QER42891.1 glycosyltransferase family 1 protein [Thermodesulfobacterium sp. TA1]
MPFKKFFVYPHIPKELENLLNISKNLWFSWNYDVLSVFYKIDPDLFRKVEHNPFKFIYYLPNTKLRALAKDQTFLMDLEDLWEAFKEYQEYVHPEIKKHRLGPEDKIVYFCAEFGLHPILPFYAGGLGVLAGDFLMSASDLGLPMLGIGLVYQHGYLRQEIDHAEKTQIESLDPLDLFLNFLDEVKNPDGSPLILSVNLMGIEAKLRVWKIKVGTVPCYFLDTNHPENPEEIKNILRYLYPGDLEKRIQQEIILGIGGYKLLKALHLEPKIYHLNEGHSAFVLLARLKDLLSQGFSLDEATMLIKETTVFTTHTPVIAGNEHFPKELVKKYLWEEIEELVEITKDKTILSECYKKGFLEGNTEIFWLPALAINSSSNVNAVSKLHQRTTKKMWHSLFSELPEEEVPIDYITNGVHWRWLSEPFYNLFKKYLGPNFIYMSPDDPTWNEILKIPDEEVWEAHKKNKYRLLNFIKNQLKEEALKLNLHEEEKQSFQLPKAQDLIIGCARRITAYKRNSLILYHKEKILRLLKEKDIVLVFAGKAHPKDIEGKNIIKEILTFRETYKLYNKIFFLKNYNLHLARYLIWGADVWLNTPFRPMEACGTSGMKAAMNGVLNLSVLDGWWPEGYNRLNGWAITPKEGLPLYNDYEANQLYNLLEKEVYPLFVERDEEGIPKDWVKMMKQSMYIACKNFSTNRMLLEYVDKFYAPIIERFKKLSQKGFTLLKALAEEKRILTEAWEKIKFIEVEENLEKSFLQEGNEVTVSAKVFLGGLNPELIEIQFVMIEEIACVCEVGGEEEKEKYVRSLPLRLVEIKDGIGVYQKTFYLQAPGPKEYNFRIVPKNPYLRRYYPNLIKWIF